MKLRLTVAATSALVALAGAAQAQQEWLQDRRYGEGIGIKTGNFELHPGIAAEFGYDSNYYQRADEEGGLDAQGEPLLPVDDVWRLRVTPSITLTTLSQRRMTATEGAIAAPPLLVLSAGAFFAYSELFGLEDDEAEQRNFNAGVGARAEIAPARPFGADIYGDFLRSGEPSNLPFEDQAFDRGTVRGGAGVSWRPGGGLFEWRLGYDLAYNYFEENRFDELNNFQHQIQTRGRWRFLPRTALNYDARYGMVRYQVNDLQPDGDYVEARVGLSGLLTSRVAFRAMVGWNSSFYEANASSQTEARNYDGYVAQGELKLLMSPTPTEDNVPVGVSSIGAGFQRDFSNSYLGSFYVRDRGYVQIDYFLGGVFLANLEGGLSRYSFPRMNALNPSFEQPRVDVRLFAEYRFSDVFGLNTSLLYDQVLDEGPHDQGLLVSDAGPDGLLGTTDDGPYYDDLSYRRFQAYLGMRLFW